MKHLFFLVIHIISICRRKQYWIKKTFSTRFFCFCNFWVQKFFIKHWIFPWIFVRSCFFLALLFKENKKITIIIIFNFNKVSWKELSVKYSIDKNKLVKNIKCIHSINKSKFIILLMQAMRQKQPFILKLYLFSVCIVLIISLLKVNCETFKLTNVWIKFKSWKHLFKH